MPCISREHRTLKGPAEDHGWSILAKIVVPMLQGPAEHQIKVFTPDVTVLHLLLTRSNHADRLILPLPGCRQTPLFVTATTRTPSHMQN